MFVFGALLVLTIVTVGVSYLHLPETPAVIIGLSIALTKARSSRCTSCTSKARAGGLLAARL